MSLTTPTTAEIDANIISQLEASLSQTIPLLPKAFLRVLARVLAGVFIILYKYGGFIFLQMFVASASNSPTEVNGEIITPLQLWGDLIGIGLPTPATQAELVIDITVTNQVGTLPTNSQLVGAKNGVTYITLGAVTLDAAVKQATVRAVSDQSGGGGAGVIGNLDPGDEMSFANPLANVARTAVVDSQTVTGADGESTDAYRQRVIDRFQKLPQGGAYADYELWAEEVAGIINAYPYTSSNPGEVDVYSEATVASSGDPDGIPTAAQLQAVLDSIELDENGLPTRRPANAYVNSLPITRTGFNSDVSGISGVSDLATVQADITTAIEDYFLNAEPFITGLTILPRRDRLTQSAVIGIVEDIVTAANGTFTTVVFSEDGVGTPLTLYSLGEGEKSKSVTVSFS